MTKIDPIIAVKDVEASSRWYQFVFGCRSMHGGKEFHILVSQDDEVLIYLHRWGEHGHPTMTDSWITPGNGLILYFRTDEIDLIRENVEKTGASFEEDIHLNPNSQKKEFSVRDLGGYYLTITEFHKYEGWNKWFQRLCSASSSSFNSKSTESESSFFWIVVTLLPKISFNSLIENTSCPFFPVMLLILFRRDFHKWPLEERSIILLGCNLCSKV